MYWNNSWLNNYNYGLYQNKLTLIQNIITYFLLESNPNNFFKINNLINYDLKIFLKKYTTNTSTTDMLSTNKLDNLNTTNYSRL